ncbi:MAG TPA: hypothetical protein ENJ09_13780 [Planctomycetes bacterium]|nr:hypothetical protein [Planctomycetota bacterium]
MESEPPTPPTGASAAGERRPLAVLAVTLGALWLLAGALFKLFLGTPNDLPPIVREFPLELGLTYNGAITIELVIAALALLVPRRGWIGLGLVFLVFDAILVRMLDAPSCGCFGSKVSLPPAVMLGIDSGLLVAMLAARPWRLAPRRIPTLVLAPTLAAVAVLPWLLDRQVTTLAEPGIAHSTEDSGAGERWLELDVESWVGKSLDETPLADFIDLDSLIPDGIWVLYRTTCDHCAAHLAHLAQTEVGERMVTLVRLEEKTDNEANRVVHLMPEGGFVQHAELPDSLTYVITTPGELIVENGIIVSAKEAASDQ